MANAPAPERLAQLRDRALRRLYERTPLYVWLNDAQGRSLWASQAWIAFSGRDTAEDLATSWASRVWPDDLERVHEELNAAFAARRPVTVEYRIRRADGEWRWVQTEGVPYEDEHGEYAGHVGTTYDFTDLRASDERLRLVAEQQRALLEHLKVAVFAIDAGGYYRFVNRAWEVRFNHRRQDTVGRHFTEFFPRDVAEAMQAENEHVLSHPGQEVARETTLLTADGAVDFFVQKMRIVDADGVTPLVYGVATDLTAVRRADEQRHRLELQIQQSQRLESLGVLAGGVAHDFNNLLVGVLGNAELVLPQVPEGTPTHDALLRIADAARRAAALASQMLAFSGRGPTALAPVSLSVLLDGMRALLASSLSPDIALEVDTRAELPPVECDASQLRQAVLNLVANAAEALADRPGRIRVGTGLSALSIEELNRCVLGEGCPAGDYAWLEVSDTGCGMDEHTSGRVFDPFFSTKFAGRGLGLPVVRGIVRGHHGALWVDSTPDRGTTVRVYLPTVVGRASASAAPEPTARGRGTVLVVEDEPAVRDVMRVALESAHHPVLVATDGVEALDVWRQHEEAIALVIADLTMPRMGGEEMLRELRRLGARVPIVLMSGYDTGSETRARTHADVTAFLDKPFSMKSLLAAVASALGRTAAGG